MAISDATILWMKISTKKVYDFVGNLLQHVQAYGSLNTRQIPCNNFDRQFFKGGNSPPKGADSSIVFLLTTTHGFFEEKKKERKKKRKSVTLISVCDEG